MYYSSVGHDGFLRTFDFRNHECISEIDVHTYKYDESIHKVLYHPD